MNAGFVLEFIDMENASGNMQPVLCREGNPENSTKQVWLACNEDVTLCRRHNGRGIACHPVDSVCLEIVEAVTLQWVRFFGTGKFNGKTRIVTKCGVRWVFSSYIPTRQRAP